MAQVGATTAHAGAGENGVDGQAPSVISSVIKVDDMGTWKGGLLEESVLKYVVAHTKEKEILARLTKDSLSRPYPWMQTSVDVAPFLALLVQLMGAKRTIEVGVFCGYSALAVLDALPENGVLVACDVDEVSMDIARKYFQEAGVMDKVDIRIGPAADTLQSLLDNGEKESYDFAFIDADKPRYIAYYELLLKLIRPGGLIVADNVLWYGKVADLSNTDEKTTAIRAFNEHVFNDDRVSASMITIGDGMSLIRKRP